MRNLAFVVAFLAPALAAACPVCGTGPERTRAAYVAMTAVMSLLPLAVIGALAFLAYRRIRAAERARLEPAPTAPAASLEPRGS